MAATIIQLSEPIDAHGQSIASIALREPRYSDFMELGAPTIWVSLEGGGGYEQETPAITRAWVERLVDVDPNLLTQINLPDTLELRNAVMRFFREARETRMRMTLSTVSPAASSSASDGQPGPSRI